MKALYGIIGYPLSHSFSPAWFNHRFESLHIDAHYESFPMANIGGLSDLLCVHPELRGLSVTIPHKQAVMSNLDSVSADASIVGAVNCISISNGRATGFNTDIIGFENSLKPILRPEHTCALILGTGGASRAVAFVLDKLDISFKFVSRTPGVNQLSYATLNDDTMCAYQIIVNTSPLGMYPETENCPPIPYHLLRPEHLLYDLIYNPSETVFLSEGRKRGAYIKNGLEMLELQAEAAWNIWGLPALR